MDRSAVTLHGFGPRLRSLLTELGVILGGVVLYFGIRGLTEGSAPIAVRHARSIVALEQDLGIDVEHRLQSLVVPSDGMSTFFNWVYIWGHWPVIAVTLLYLWWHNRTVYLRLRNAMLISGGMGLIVFTTYPVAPPRLAGLGLVDTITERSVAYRVLQPPQFVNQYAALPSLHVGWDLLVGIALVTAAGTLWLRSLGVVMPVLMALATVVTANHYVIDVLAGTVCALVGLAAALLLERRRLRGGPPPLAAERSRPAAPSPRREQVPGQRPRRTADAP
ncbi:MAG: phosphatase family protein [Frankiales bacterium]|nr:phosphatase family protein [Frankiales bacterium]